MNKLKERQDQTMITIGDMFEGTIAQWEENFGYLSAMNDKEAMMYICEWADKNKFTMTIG